MNTPTLSPPLFGADPYIITVKEVDVMSVIETHRRPSLKRFITGPVSQLQKCKWTTRFIPHHHRTPSLSPKTTSSEENCATEDNEACTMMTTSKGSPQESQDHREQSFTAERVVGTLKRLIRKDSHHSDTSLLPSRTMMMQSVNERRNSKLGKANIEKLAAEGVASLPHVGRFLDMAGEEGPSDYYHSRIWTKFQTRFQADCATSGNHSKQSLKKRFLLSLSSATRHTYINKRTPNYEAFPQLNRQNRQITDTNGFQISQIDIPPSRRSSLFDGLNTPNTESVGEQPDQRDEQVCRSPARIPWKSSKYGPSGTSKPLPASPNSFDALRNINNDALLRYSQAQQPPRSWDISSIDSSVSFSDSDLITPPRTHANDTSSIDISTSNIVSTQLTVEQPRTTRVTSSRSKTE